MKFGINILNFGSGTGPETLMGWAKFAEDMGFHLVMLSDHVAITPDVQEGFPAPFFYALAGTGSGAGGSVGSGGGSTFFSLTSQFSDSGSALLSRPST